MAKGTKQIRLGRVEKIVDKLETRLEFLEEAIRDLELGEKNPFLFGQKKELELAIALLRGEFGL